MDHHRGDSAPPSATTSAYPHQLLSDMLARSLGVEKSAEVVSIAVAQLKLGTHLERADALRVLEVIAQQSGIVGIAARFAKSRVHLVWDSKQR